MSVATRHDLAAVVLDTSVLGGITRLSLPTGTEIRGERSSGNVHRFTQSLVRQKPSFSFTTLSIAAALNKLGTAGWGLSGNGFSAYAQKHAEGGSRAAGAAHAKYTATEGIAVPRTLRASHEADATLEADVLVTYDGTNEPIVKTENVNLPSGAVETVRFGMGPVQLGGVAYEGKTSLEIEFGVDAQTLGADSEIWDTFASVDAVLTIVRLRGIVMSWFGSGGIPLTGTALPHASTTFYLRKYLTGGSFVADATAEHVRFTAAGLAYIESAVEAGDGAAEVSLAIPLFHDGTNEPLLVQTAAAIT